MYLHITSKIADCVRDVFVGKEDAYAVQVQLIQFVFDVGIEVHGDGKCE